jgi:hypothetical protein
MLLAGQEKSTRSESPFRALRHPVLPKKKVIILFLVVLP